MEKEYTITVTESELLALDTVISYGLENEESHFEESQEEGEDVTDHIYTHLKKLDAMRDRTKDVPANA